MLGLGKLVDGLVVRYRSWHDEQILELLSTPVLMVPELLGLELVESVELLKYLVLAHEQRWWRCRM